MELKGKNNLITILVMPFSSLPASIVVPMTGSLTAFPALLFSATVII